MDLSTFSKETLINMIQDQQKLINEQQKQINSYKIPAIPKQQKVSSSDSYQVYNEDTQQEWDTHNADEFCCNCKHYELSKMRVKNFYKCLGHTIE